MSPVSPSHSDSFSRANCIRRGFLFGGALGMLAGLIWIGFDPPEGPETVSIVRWRNTILVGIGIGILTGIFWPKPSSKEVEHD